VSKSEAWYRRLKLLHYLIRRGYAQTADAAAYLGVERRLVRGDMTALQDHGVPLFPHPEHDTRDPDRAWKLEKSWRIAGLEVKLNERLAMLLGREVLDPLIGGSEIGDALTHLDKEIASVAGGVETSDSELLRRFHLVQEPSKSYDHKGQIVSDLVEAIAHSFRVSLEYQSPRRDTPKRHERLRPLTLAIYRRGLYVFAYFGDSDEVGVFSVDRIVSLDPLPEDQFDYPIKSRWDPERFLARRFGLSPGQTGPQLVRLRVPPESRLFALERPWMSDQTVLELEDGSLEISFTAEGSELAHQILAWGGYCEVLEPASLRQKVLELARAVIARYESPT
jgi:predicted DNA-binding transcriptional regulator YafY